VKKIYLIRHGETEWTLSRQHTGATDIPLTENGIEQAHLLAERLKGREFKAVFASPLLRSRQTCEIAGFSDEAVFDPRLVEWNYGAYEGLTTKQIHAQDPQWNIFQNGAPDGESVEDIQHRTAGVLKEILAIQGDVAIFSHAHFLRALAVRFIDLSIIEGRHFTLFPASISILAYENASPAISLWNDISHLV
jgi:probable phosphoglycerate mutase